MSTIHVYMSTNPSVLVPIVSIVSPKNVVSRFKNLPLRPDMGQHGKWKQKKCGLKRRFLLWRPVSWEDFCSIDWTPGSKSNTNYSLYSQAKYELFPKKIYSIKF